jgi:hypothetical protein
MTNTFLPEKRVELLLNTLANERYARRALLAELIEELATTPSRHPAARAARSLLRSLDEKPITSDVYAKRIVRIGDLAGVPVAGSSGKRA